MKYEPENKNFNYNEYIHRLGGRQYFHTEELSADEIKSKYKEFQTDGQFVATERIDIYNLNKEDNIYKKLKGHIIICRRYVQGILDGNKYPKKLVEKNFKDFKELIQENSEEFIQNLNTRWLTSIMKCYIDCGNNEEKMYGMIVIILEGFHEIDNRVRDLNHGHWKVKHPWAPVPIFEYLNIASNGNINPIIKGVVKKLLDDENFLLNRYLKAFDERRKLEVPEAEKMKKLLVSLLDSPLGSGDEEDYRK
jgi:hypothetical protein|tara:strand:+ start:2577 stop:3326 length:750 start_codon:yes stop_codon:yes gene_type:complete